VAKIDLNELAKKPEYTATVRSLAEKDASVTRHLRIVGFYTFLGLTVAALLACFSIYIGWLSAPAEQQAWARDVLQTLFPAAAAYAVGRHQGNGTTAI
jgi:hypothetical protein